ncbi:hypothetical protein IB279_13650 [Ensifer sp. ENS06]|uniref:hypothetical protein n=1 Tax=unclassified Ensifer TaxID=2633371 RepID=UPI001781D125|nr:MULTISPECIES: hypothetical protein [unclassified Ensifer]MBD9597970.1 hypothetical protein [Ensifer sp. ENS05]MBD9623987.1 hypothetical protein [Ensifer sp. ENS06]
MDVVSPAEQSRLQTILAAAKAADWNKFETLTDRPFSNTASMREQFEDSSKLIRSARREPNLTAILKHHEDGSRLIFAKIELDDPADQPIMLTLHSTSAEPQSAISIWTFYQEIDFG